MLWGASRLLPPLGILHWSWSQWRGDYPPPQLDWSALATDAFDTMLRAAMMHRFGVSLRLPELPPELLERLREHVRLYREVLAPLVRDGVLVPDHPAAARRARRTRSGDPAPRAGTPTSSPRSCSTAASDRLSPRGLDADRSYAVTDLATGGATTATSTRSSIAARVGADGARRRSGSWPIAHRPPPPRPHDESARIVVGGSPCTRCGRAQRIRSTIRSPHPERSPLRRPSAPMRASSRFPRCGGSTGRRRPPPRLPASAIPGSMTASGGCPVPSSFVMPPTTGSSPARTVLRPTRTITTRSRGPAFRPG